MPGVTDASVNYGNGQAAVAFSTGAISQMQIVHEVSSLGYQAHVGGHDHGDRSEEERMAELKRLKGRLSVSAVLTIPLLVGAMVPQAPGILMNVWVMFALATPVQLWAGRSFYQSAWSALKNKTANMDTLVALGTGVAYLSSVVAILFPAFFAHTGSGTFVFFETSATIISLVLLGKVLELSARGKATNALKKLLGLQATSARVQRGGVWEDVPVTNISVGDRILIRSGESIPVDGTIVHGTSSVDESLVTGESIPVPKTVGEIAIGGTQNGQGSLEITARHIGADTVLANIIRMVREAQGSRPPIHRLVDRVSAVFVPVVIVLSLVTFGLWWMFGPDGSVSTAVIRAVAILIVACPCALGLATPISIIVGVGRASELGILIRDAEALEMGTKVTTVVFDKTGTLTVGKPSVTSWMTNGHTATDDQTMKNVRAIEERSTHPLASAIVEYLRSTGSSDEMIEEYRDHPGRGVRATINGDEYLIGSVSFVIDEGVDIPQDLHSSMETQRSEGATIVAVSAHRILVGFFSIADAVREEARDVISALRKRGITTVMLSGDTEAAARAVGGAIGIDRVIGRVLPETKAERVRALKSDGQITAMIGDGVNDAPALATADLGIAMGSGTDVARETAGVVLLHNDLRLVLAAFDLSRGTMRNIRENLGWAFGYNVLLIPLAMGVLAPFTGIAISPMLAAFAMALSSVSVVLNALRLTFIHKTRTE